MNRAFLTLLAVLACLPVWGQSDLPPSNPPRDQNGFLVIPPAPRQFATPAATNSPVAPSAPAAPAIGTPATDASAPPAGVSAIPPRTSTEDTNFLTSSLAALTSAYNLDDKHKLAPGDHISFQIIEDRTNAVPLLVTESSELDVPYIGRISVADKTCKELAGELKGLLEKDYYYKATVIIGLDELGKLAGKVYIVGPVLHPGPVEIPANENFTAAKAILEAGGFGDFANKNEVEIFRKSPTGNQKFTVNMNAVMKGNTDQDVTLQDGDFIVVKTRAFNM